MDFSSLCNVGIRKLMPYRMGKPLEMIKDELGVKNLIRLNAGESPFGVSHKVRSVLQRYEEKIAYYPDGSAYFLKDALRSRYGYAVSNITVGADNGELLSLLTRAFVKPEHNIIIPRISSSTMERTATLTGAEIKIANILDDWTPNFDDVIELIDVRTRMIMLSNPTNPIGAFSVYSDIENFLSAVPEDVIVVIDEELIDYLGAGYRDLYGLIFNHPNLVLLRSFSHAYGLASLRIGYMLSCEEICGIANTLRDPFNVSQLAIDCAIAALSDQAFYQKVVHANDVERNRFKEFCSYYGLPLIDTRTCSVTIDFGELAERYYQAFLQLGVFTRPLGYLGLPTLINISIGHPRHTDFFLTKLEKFILNDFKDVESDNI